MNGSNTLMDTVWGHSCIPLQNCNSVPISDTTISPSYTPKGGDPCVNQFVSGAKANALNAYNNYIDSITTSNAAGYMNHCLGAVEGLTAAYTDKQYHYTLYYYDQGGNLVRTVPPQGVSLVDTSYEHQIIADRTAGIHNYFTNDVLSSTYVYNSLNQLTEQSVPDADNMNIWSFTLPNGLLKSLVITGTQFTDAQNGYLSGYVPASGSYPKRGYLYKSFNAGNNWQQVNEAVAGNLTCVAMVNSTTGYAVGNNGLVLETVDGANSWDIIPLYSRSITQQLNGLATDHSQGVVVGNGVAFTLNGTTYTVNTGITSGDNLMSVTWDSINGKFYAVGDSLGYGVFYSRSASGTSWSKISNNTSSLPLYKVQFLTTNLSANNPSHGVATGLGGMLLHTTDKGAHWFAVPNYLHKNIRSVYFVTDNIGIALVDSTSDNHNCQLYQTGNGGQTWSLLSTPGSYYYDMNFYYDVSSSTYKGIAVGYKGIVTRIVSQTSKAPYFALIPLNSPTKGTLTGVFAQEYSNNLYVTLSSTSHYMYYSIIPNSSTSALWKSVNVGTSTAKTAFLLSGSNMLACAVGNTTQKIYLFTSNLATPPVFTADSVTATNLSTANTNKPFYDLIQHGAVGSDTLYAYNSGHGLYTLLTNTTELKITPITGTNPSDIISLGYSANLKMAGVDSVSGHVYTGTISGTSVTWTTVSQNIHPLTLYAVQAITGVSGSHTIVYETGLKGEVLYDSIVSTGNTSVELIPPTTRTLYDVGLVTGNNGYLVGDSTSIYNFPHYRGISVSGYSPSYTQYKPAVASTNPLYDITINGTTAYIAGAAGTVYYIKNTSSPTVTLASSGSGTNNFVGITNVGSGAIAVGSNSQMWMYGGTSAMQITSLHTPGFNAVNFQADALHGYVVGDSSTIRRSDDGGNTWQLVLPDLGSSVKNENYKSVWTTGVGQGIVSGNGNFLGSVSTGNLVSHFSGYAYTVSGGSSAQTWNKIKFNQNYPNAGYAVGNAGVSGSQVLTLGVSGGALTTVGSISTTSYGIDATPLNALHVLRDNSILVAGASGKAYYYNPIASPVWTNETPTRLSGSYSAFTWNDAWARDDRNFYLVGDSIISAAHLAGEIIKGISPVNIQPATSGDTAGFISWNLEPVEDGASARNIVTGATQVNYNTIAFSGPYNGIVGGAYTSSISGTPAYPNARLINDMGGMFSQLNWYDRLGRLIVSQNTKQHNYKRPAYSYTLYDQLNRRIETGQKTENSSSTKFSSIFGDTVFTNVANPLVISSTKFLAWINDNTGPRTEVTHDYYDVQTRLPLTILVQNELRNRISGVTYTDTARADSSYQNANFYSYDVIGKTKTLIQDDSVYNIGSGQRYKRIDYQYDLVSGNVNEVDYQNDSLDAYHHKYIYDDDNRLTQVQTSKDSVNWDNDASYFYYLHGPLARIELGDQQVQGMDYAYTLQGWIKGVNSDKLTASVDMGEDGLKSSGNLNRYFARDAMGYTLKYFDHSQNPAGGDFPGDYDAIDTIQWKTASTRFEAYTYGSDLINTRHNLFNGNISAMATNIQQPQAYSEGNTSQSAILLPQGTSYGYDQLNRLVEMKAFQNLDTTTNVWGTTGIYNGLYHNWLSYDANGNILTQKRADQNGNVFDSLNYRYNIEGGRTLQNRLYHVNNFILDTVDGIVNNIRNQGTFDTTEAQINLKNNYRYNAMGELAKDSSAGLDTIIWTLNEKIWKIKKYNGDSIIFAYDGKGDRVLKEYKPASGNPVSTYYVNDAKGEILSIYTKQIAGMSMSFTQSEREIYGSSRIGAEKTSVQLIAHTPVSSVDTFKRYLGNKEYELENHLSSVLAVVSDRKIPRPNSAHDSINHYEADILNSGDYYPFGMLENARNFSTLKYKFGFDGRLKDDEITGYTGTDYDYGMRMLDVRLGRFMTPDPLARKYPNLSTYQFASNTPIQATDLNGLEAASTIYKQDGVTPKQLNLASDQIRYNIPNGSVFKTSGPSSGPTFGPEVIVWGDALSNADNTGKKADDSKPLFTFDFGSKSGLQSLMTPITDALPEGTGKPEVQRPGVENLTNQLKDVLEQKEKDDKTKNAKEAKKNDNKDANNKPRKPVPVAPGSEKIEYKGDTARIIYTSSTGKKDTATYLTGEDGKPKKIPNDASKKAATPPPPTSK